MALKIYKPGQGRYARIGAGVLLGVLVAYGCRSLAGQIPTGNLMETSAITLTYEQVIPVVVFLGVILGLAIALNMPKVADFLIETEIEMGRVIWPSRAAVIASSTVVIVTMVVMAALLWGVDFGLLKILELVRLY